MIRGIKLFRERFRDYEGAFVLIGGAACDEWFSTIDDTFRGTKDLDIVLIIEVVDPAFVAAIHAFREEGGYEIEERVNGLQKLQWSARKAQLLATRYKANGGGYRD